MQNAMSYDDLEPNAQIGHYTIIEHVAEGGMGHVYKGFEASLQREVAIKVLKPELANETAKLAEFDKEAQNIAALRHPNIVPIYYVGHQGELHFFVMPFVSGVTLDEWVERETPLSIDQGVWVLNQAIEALDWAFRHNIVHMDIKPSNFLVDDSGVIYLTDFGLAHSLSDALRSDGECYGTPAYMSPEQILQLPTDQRSDIYSLGASLYHLLTCKFLHDGDTVSDIIRGHVEGIFPMEDAVASGLPPGWIHLLQRMTMRDPDNRYQDYGELRLALQNVDMLGPLNMPGDSTAAYIPVPLRTTVPREQLYGLLSKRFIKWAGSSIDSGIQRKREEIERAINNPMKPLLLNSLAKPLKELPEVSEVEMTDLADALNALPEVDRFIQELARTQLFRPDEEPNTRRKCIKAVGVDLSRQIVLFGIALRQDFKPAPEFDWQPYWQHALATGLVARLLIEIVLGEYEPGTGRVSVKSQRGITSALARHAVNRARQQALLAGILHGIGKLVLAEIVPFPYYNVLRAAADNQTVLSDTETHYFGINHHEVGRIWLEGQRFDSSLRQVAAQYGTCDQKTPLLVSAVALAHQMSKIHGIGYSGSAIIEYRDLWSTAAWRELTSAGGSQMPSPETLEQGFLPLLGQLPLLQPPVEL
jgi:serine/threonine protein kinase